MYYNVCFCILLTAELGDYDPRDHRGNYLEGMIFGPKQVCSTITLFVELYEILEILCLL